MHYRISFWLAVLATVLSVESAEASVLSRWLTVCSHRIAAVTAPVNWSEVYLRAKNHHHLPSGLYALSKLFAQHASLFELTRRERKGIEHISQAFAQETLATDAKEAVKDFLWSAGPFLWRAVAAASANARFDVGLAAMLRILKEPEHRDRLSTLGITESPFLETLETFLQSSIHRDYIESRLSQKVRSRAVRPFLFHVFTSLLGFSPLSYAYELLSPPTIPSGRYFDQIEKTTAMEAKPQRTVILLDRQFMKKTPSGESRHAPETMADRIPRLRELRRQSSEFRVELIDSAEDFAGALARITENDERVIFWAHGSPGVMSFGDEPFSKLLAQTLRSPPPKTHKRLQIIFFSCEFGAPKDEAPRSIDDEAWITLSKHLLGHGSEGQAFAATVTLTFGYERGPDPGFICLAGYRCVSSAAMTGVGFTHFWMADVVRDYLKGHPRPTLRVYDAKTDRVEDIEVRGD